MKKTVLAVASLLFAFGTAAADDSGSHPRHVALFLGSTMSDDHSDFTVGADYDYRLEANPLFSVGALVDHAVDRHTIVAPSLGIHPAKDLKITLAPGIELAKGGHNEFVARVGAGYGFPWGHYSIAPSIFLDFVKNHRSTVAGIAVGRGF